MAELRHRDVKSLAQCHTAIKKAELEVKISLTTEL